MISHKGNVISMVVNISLHILLLQVVLCTCMVTTWWQSQNTVIVCEMVEGSKAYQSSVENRYKRDSKY